jgi:hypothetical protein
LSYGTAHDLLAGVAYRFQAALWGLGLRSCGFPWKWNPPLTSGPSGLAKEKVQNIFG